VPVQQHMAGLGIVLARNEVQRGEGLIPDAARRTLITRVQLARRPGYAPAQEGFISLTSRRP